ncbi:N-acetyl-1-D-myo-inositol-2-amino-2-deoxy-alpha-D-glucopyranoside deacetylase [Corynebacterium sp. TAE3-ERU12]|uniref:N-acetyl-1-D-myo-inositol-2-amino-2-deoxy-alpha- D-glucopyranoside deacetylase n=1 Tax=Corynebacterium sp. TAE3-ERU12 TaxID=2849491 RepID=UPI001C4857A3|nr:N-acetyl-1-D-myo-inositol-2-amino-2-deoxy-alpha-D-glucopyranoside deacetylase [Corynebacterium sp. TAE3-ERU12]MBV7295043.1 N-acetyl-1-D-myo-inositol-2-amino-2-deoxy-alpha-D-glucopyranoside deacetylase [Corynebacterium sp. TAE3-ERU12]
MPLSHYRIAAVHAHPDDESIWTGGLLAKLRRLGADVSVITCTLGEHGEIIGDTYQALGDHQLDQLGAFRVRELADALAVLGVNGPAHQPRLLGGLGAYHDSGMAGSATAENTKALVNSGAAAVEELMGLLAAVRPHLVISYDADGGYGHPDHIRAHELTVAATERLRAECTAADEAGLYGTAWAVTDRQALQAGLDAITEIPDGWRPTNTDEIACADAGAAGAVAVHLDAEDITAKREAMAAHATQVWIGDGRISDTNPEPAVGAVDGSGAAAGVWALSNLLCQPLLPVEHYVPGTVDRERLSTLLGN